MLFAMNDTIHHKQVLLKPAYENPQNVLDDKQESRGPKGIPRDDDQHAHNRETDLSAVTGDGTA